ncbi:serine protease ndl [Lepeophtheirus salmonis]|uniref:serine protease ndl n=1 Tax=Lepeophtheirus salmonis TaxID=72036 RepID=UPI001AE8E0C3|nr:serine protease nudel-like [Lepeophtheirus salmonis]
MVCGLNNTECYSDKVRCDGVVDCSDFADELQCSGCETFLNMGYLGISREDKFICDGVFDCPNGEDEMNCGKNSCSPDQYYCADSDICIPSIHRCDLKRHCPDGSDEKDCVSLWPEPVDPEYSNVISPHANGILHWKVNDTWKVLSLSNKDKDAFIDARSGEICTEILLHNEGVLPKSHKIKYFFRSPDINVPPTSRAHISMKPNISEFDLIRREFHFGDVPNDAVYVNLDCGTMECGARSYSYKPEMADIGDFFKQRIVGGSESVPFDWPSIAAVYIDGILLCGGTVIDKNWILSAAHCYKGVKEGKSVVEVIVGMSRVDSRSPYTQVRQVQEIIHHGNFNGTYLTHDVALLYFEEPILFNAKVNLVCLNDAPVLPSVGEHCITVGWGSTHESENNVNNEMLQVEVPIKNKCIQGYNHLDHQICGGFPIGGRDACQGDSGGPLYCASSGKDGYNKHYLAGIVSHGIGCARPETDGVYVRITYYLDWIKTIMNVKNEQINTLRSRRSADSQSFERFVSTANKNYPDVSFVYRRLNKNCPSGVRCDNNRCIAQSQVCDERFNCMDRKDELDCKPNAVGQKYYAPGYWDSISNIFPTITTEKITEITKVTSEPTSIFTQSPIEDMQIYSNPKECEDGFFTCKFIQECLPMDIKCDFKKDCMDGSDETNCLCVDYLRKNGSQICDGISDCPDSSDELNCETCGSDEFFCDLSSKCIPKKKVCDKIIDCKFKEDERHCITLVPYTQQEGIKVLYSEERPIKFNHGYIALNYKGVWSPLCIANVSSWNSEMNDRVCNYQNSLRSVDFNYVKANELKDSDFLSSPLRVEREDGSQIEALDEPSEFSMCETGVIQSSCSETTRCGVHPMYSSVKDYESIEKMDVEGLFPWQVTLYQEGQYMCGASLIHRNWIMTSKECSSKMKPSRNYVVARMGGFRNGRFLSPHEQVRQVIQFTRVPHTGISLGTFRNAVDLGKYVNPVCIPSTNWFPFRGQCIISGIDHRAGILNRGVKMSVEEICEINTSYDYSVCTELVDKDEDVCMDNWSGTLSCLDHSNRYYVLGVYHTSNGGCENPGTGGKRNAFPTKFRSVSTATARDAIRKIVSIFNTNVSMWHDVDDNCATHRCPLGKCLKSSEICDGIPHCGDMSDEREYICGDRPIVRLNDASLCLPINSTHCGCKKDQFMCKRTRLCLERNAFCDGVDDCGDSSDEPSGCGDCVTALRTLKPESICDGNIDCIIKGSDSIGSDESSKQCCNLKNSIQPFRCVSGNMLESAHKNLSISDDCVDISSVCDHCKGHAPGDCRNGADDEDCLSISARDSSYTEDVFGRPESRPQGYLHYIAYGKRYLYCAGQHFYGVLEKDSDLRMKAAEILCRNEGYYYSGQLTFHQTVEKHYVFSYENEDYKSCKLVYIVCGNRPTPS